MEGEIDEEENEEGKQNVEDWVRQFRENQLKELLQVLEQEERQENERANMLTSITDHQEKLRLDKILGIERAKAKERIDDLIL